MGSNAKKISFQYLLVFRCVLSFLSSRTAATSGAANAVAQAVSQAEAGGASSAQAQVGVNLDKNIFYYSVNNICCDIFILAQAEAAGARPAQAQVGGFPFTRVMGCAQAATQPLSCSRRSPPSRYAKRNLAPVVNLKSFPSPCCSR